MPEYIVLRKPRRNANNNQGKLATKGIVEARTAKSPLLLTYETLDPRQASEVSRSPDVLEITRPIRTRLVRPMRKGIPTACGSSWGIEAVGAHTSSFSGAGVKIAVLDTGIDSSHAAFTGINLTRMNFTNDGDDDRDGHGTHCAGTIFGRDVGGCRIGIARGVTEAFIGKILNDKGEGDSKAIFDGVLWAANNGADIISMSVGFDFPGEVGDLVDDGWPIDVATSVVLDLYHRNLRIFEAAFSMTETGIFPRKPLLVAAAGNESRRDVDPSFEVYASLPAAAFHLSVAAVQRAPAPGKYRVSSFSNSHPTIAAPGVGILSAEAGGHLVEFDGTSMACPHVAGVAALWAESLRGKGTQVNGSVLRSHLTVMARTNVIGSYDINGNSSVGCGMLTAP